MIIGVIVGLVIIGVMGWAFFLSESEEFDDYRKKNTSNNITESYWIRENKILESKNFSLKFENNRLRIELNEKKLELAKLNKPKKDNIDLGNLFISYTDACNIVKIFTEKDKTKILYKNRYIDQTSLKPEQVNAILKENGISLVGQHETKNEMTANNKIYRCIQCGYRSNNNKTICTNCGNDWFIS